MDVFSLVGRGRPTRKIVINVRHQATSNTVCKESSAQKLATDDDVDVPGVVGAGPCRAALRGRRWLHSAKSGRSWQTRPKSWTRLWRKGGACWPRWRRRKKRCKKYGWGSSTTPPRVGRKKRRKVAIDLHLVGGEPLTVFYSPPEGGNNVTATDLCPPQISPIWRSYYTPV